VHRLILALALLLSACAAPAPDGAFRRADTPIYSNAVLDTARLSGRWVQVATFAAQGAPGCRPGGADLTQGPDGLTLATRLCLNGVEVSHAGPMVLTGPGRLTAKGRAPPPLDEEWWLLWVDTDLRTLVIGTPSGSFGFILNRDARLPADRFKAARDVLVWNGYDTANLRIFAPN
jgi:apolipoprotein D and lipocalin family protein